MRTRRLGCITTGSDITTRRIGNYISQDPIRLAGNNPTLYAFVTDPNLWVDVFGLEIIPNKAAGLKREGIGKEWIQKNTLMQLSI